MLQLAFAAAWAVVIIANVVVAVQIVLLLKTLRQRARAVIPKDLPVQLRIARGDVQRALGAFVQLTPLTKRGAVALASIAHSVATFLHMARAVRAVWRA